MNFDSQWSSLPLRELERGGVRRQPRCARSLTLRTVAPHVRAVGPQPTARDYPDCGYRPHGEQRGSRDSVVARSASMNRIMAVRPRAHNRPKERSHRLRSVSTLRAESGRRGSAWSAAAAIWRSASSRSSVSSARRANHRTEAFSYFGSPRLRTARPIRAHHAARHRPSPWPRPRVGCVNAVPCLGCASRP